MKLFRPDLRVQTLYVFSFLLLLFSIFYNIGQLELEGEEPRRAVVSMEMIISKDYLAPQINGYPYYNKPPMFNWVLVAFMKFFDSYDEWVIRIPSLISLFLIGIFNFLIFRKFTNSKIALTSSLMFIASADIIFYGSLYSGELDLFFSLITYLQIMLLIVFYIKGHYYLMFAMSYFLASIGFMTKGIPSLVFQLITLFGVLLVDRKLKKLFSVQHITGLLFLVGPLLFNFILYSKDNNLNIFLIRQITEALHKSAVEVSMEKHFGSFLTYPFLVLQLILPWSFIVLAFYSKKSIKLVRESRILFFMFLFIALNIPVYWFSNYQTSRYIYMFFPFMINILCYVYYNRVEQGDKIFKVIDYTLLIAFFLCILALLINQFLPIIPFEIEMHMAVLIILFITLTSYFFWKSKNNRLIFVVIFIGLIKLVENHYFIPYKVKSTEDPGYRSTITTLLSYSNGNPIYLTGDPFIIGSFRVESIVTFQATSFRNPPIIPYQIPYFLMKEKHYIMEYHPEPIDDFYYLSTSGIPEGKEILFKFWDSWQGRELILFRQ